jgi:hypothetical protein
MSEVMSLIKKVLLSIFVLCLFLFGIYIIVKNFPTDFIEIENSISDIGIGAFFGTLVALIILGIKTIIIKMYTIQGNYRNALGIYQRMLYDNLQINKENISELTIFQKKNSNHEYYIPRLTDLEVDKNYLGAIAFQPLLMSLHSVHTSIRIINSGLNNLLEVYKTNIELCKNKIISENDLIKCFNNNISEMIEDRLNSLKNIHNDLIKTVSQINYSLHFYPVLIWFVGLFSLKFRKPKDYDNWINQEKVKIENVYKI